MFTAPIVTDSDDKTTTPDASDDRTPDACDSETESLMVHPGESCVANLDDLLSETECETDVEVAADEDHIHSGLRNLSQDAGLEPRTQTRLLSRSHSVSDLNNNVKGGAPDLEPPRRNSSGEYPTSLSESHTPLLTKPTVLSDIEINPRYKNALRNSYTPNFQQAWRGSITPSNHDREGEFSLLLQTTAERVLNKIKSRQMDLGCQLTVGQRFQRRPSHGLQLPRKLEPINRDENRTPKPECNLKTVNGEEA